MPISPEVRQPRCVSQQAGLALSPRVLQMCGLQGASGRSRLLRARRCTFLRKALRGAAEAEMRRMRRGEYVDLFLIVRLTAQLDSHVIC